MINLNPTQIALKLIKPYKDNAKKHPKEQIEILKTSISEFGFRNPILLNNLNSKEIVAGHGRYLAAKELNIDTLPCLSAEDLTENQIKAFRIMDNKSAESEWDFGLLQQEMKELEGNDFDLDLTGFGFDEIAGIMKDGREEVEEDDFDTEKALKEPKYKVERGDVWQLGENRLMCGDSMVKEDVDLLMCGCKADMVFTDPPYGVGIGRKNKSLNSVGIRVGNLDSLKGDDSVETASKLWDKAFKNISLVLNGAYYITAPQGGDHEFMMMMMMMRNSIPCRHELIWVKNIPAFSMGRLDYDYKHEPILYGWIGKHHFYGSGNFTKSVWNIDRPSESKLHPTMKPLKLIENAILNSSLKNMIVLDVFGGSGSTLIACEQLNRKCFMMEIDPTYCSVIIERWEAFTGKKATKS